MRGTIRRWGNSLALRLPRHVADEAKLTEGSTVEFELQDGALKVIPARRKLTLSELLEGEPQENGTAEVDWGERRGNESW
jgi:antitoxin MazE